MRYSIVYFMVGWRRKGTSSDRTMCIFFYIDTHTPSPPPPFSPLLSEFLSSYVTIRIGSGEKKAQKCLFQSLCHMKKLMDSEPVPNRRVVVVVAVVAVAARGT